jgi:septum site-determining protein MinD
MKIIAVLSGKGGVGKTTTVSNVCAALTTFRKNVIGIDCNISSPDLGLHCGVYSSLYTLKDALKGKVSLEKTLYTCPSGLRIIPAPLSFNLPDVSMNQIKDSLKQLDGELILLDAPPGLGRDVHSTLDISDGALIVTNPEIPAVTDALRTVEVCRLKKVPVVGIVLNRIRKEKREISLKEIRGIFDVPILAAIPEDPKVREAIAVGNPVVFNSPSSRASIEFKKLAGVLVGYRYEPSLLGKIKGLFKIFKREEPLKLEEVLRERTVRAPVEELTLEQPAEEEEAVEIEEAVKKATKEPAPSLTRLRTKLRITEATLEKLDKQFKDGLIREKTYNELKERYMAECEEIRKALEDKEGKAVP